MCQDGCCAVVRNTCTSVRLHAAVRDPGRLLLQTRRSIISVRKVIHRDPVRLPIRNVKGRPKRFWIRHVADAPRSTTLRAARVDRRRRPIGVANGLPELFTQHAWGVVDSLLLKPVVVQLHALSVTCNSDFDSTSWVSPLGKHATISETDHVKGRKIPVFR